MADGKNASTPETTLPPIGKCASCGMEIGYGESYTVEQDRGRRHSTCKNAMTNKTTIPTWGIASRISDRALVSCQDVAQSVLHAGSGRRKYWGVQGGVFALRYGFVPLRQRLIENREVS